MKPKLTLTLACALAAFAAAANASTVIYDDLNHDPNAASPYNVDYSVAFGAYQFASGFTPTASLQLTSVSVAVGFSPYDDNPQMELNVYSSRNGVPAVLLESIQFTGEYDAPGLNLRTIDSVTHPVLQAGKTYFIGLEEIGSNHAIWYFSDYSLGYPGFDYQLGSGAWGNESAYPPAMEVLGDAIGPVRGPGGGRIFDSASTPEPFTCALTGGGLLLVALSKRRRKSR